MTGLIIGIGTAMAVLAAAIAVWLRAAHVLAAPRQPLANGQRRYLAATVAGISERNPGPCGFCNDLTVIGDPGECICPVPCGREWCTALRRERAAARTAARPYMDDELGREDPE